MISFQFLIRWTKSIFILFLFLSLPITGIAQNNAVQSHTVQKGETLFSIAQKYDVTVDQLKEWNNLTGTSLRVGQDLRIQASSGKQPTIHTVSRGETLYGISKKYKVSISAIRKWNNLGNDALSVGQKLKIFESNIPNLKENSSGKDAQADSTNQLIADATSIQTTYYTVKAGDNLYNIARDFKMDVAQLKTLNDLKSNTIRVGQRLTVRSPRSDLNVVESEKSAAAVQGNFRAYTLQQKRTPSEIISQFQMDSTEFAALNPDISWEMPLIKGDKITILTPAQTQAANPYRVNSKVNDLGSTPISTYQEDAVGSPTTSGELYNPNELTAAHATIALGTVIFVENPTNQHATFVLINDRVSQDGLKLSQKAYGLLGLQTSTTIDQKVKIYKQN